MHRRATAHASSLNFEAVDWQSTVWVNDKQVGAHKGGYTPFSFDITTALRSGENTLTVRVFDPTDSGLQPLGKQRRLNYVVEDHIWDPDAPLMRGDRPECNAGSGEEFLELYSDLIDTAARLKAEQGMCAAVYTELSDIEAEPKGFATHDRALMVNPARMKAINERVTGARSP